MLLQETSFTCTTSIVARIELAKMIVNCFGNTEETIRNRCCISTTHLDGRLFRRSLGSYAGVFAACLPAVVAESRSSPSHSHTSEVSQLVFPQVSQNLAACPTVLEFPSLPSHSSGVSQLAFPQFLSFAARLPTVLEFHSLSSNSSRKPKSSCDAAFGASDKV